MSTRTLQEIERDFQSYKALSKQKGVTLYAEKYVEDVGILLGMLPNSVPATNRDTKRSSEKAKAPKAE